MSFILDALKKSEAERQRQIAPGLMVPATAQRGRRLPPWAVAMLGLLALNLLVLGAVFMRRKPAVAPTASPTAAPTAVVPASAARITATAPTAPTAPARRDATTDDAPLYAPEVPVAAADNPIVAAARARLGTTTAAASAPPRVSAADEESTPAATLPSIATMHFTGADALAPLHLDVHVYAADPAARFVFINAHKYIEGQALREGPRVVRIRRDGVVLEYHGKRFLLPRQ
ncbi:MAG: general secretion pathway protein GspB [Gammaproteobacteria bacterium]|nr:general secretion pathway protein GspB [Gammaproteobacteria bacterium]